MSTAALNRDSRDVRSAAPARRNPGGCEPPGCGKESSGVRLLFGRVQRRDNVGGGALYAVDRCGQRVCIAVPDLDECLYRVERR